MPPETPRSNPILELRDVSKFYGDLPALMNVQLEFRAAESVLLYGPNGAGKTTLLRILASLARPTEGQVLFAGEDMHRDLAAAKARTGFVSHATFLYGELTAWENLKFAGLLFGLPDLERKIGAALDLFGLRDRGGVPVRELSRGLQQRVALARGFLHEPSVLLLDEPFSGLDAQTTESLQSLLRPMPDKGRLLVFSTHDFELGAAVARRLVALEKGRIVYDGPIDRAPFDALRIARADGRIGHA